MQHSVHQFACLVIRCQLMFWCEEINKALFNRWAQSKSFCKKINLFVFDIDSDSWDMFSNSTPLISMFLNRHYPERRIQSNISILWRKNKISEVGHDAFWLTELICTSTGIIFNHAVNNHSWRQEMINKRQSASRTQTYIFVSFSFKQIHRVSYRDHSRVSLSSLMFVWHAE